jgi:hypothetical protein
MPPPGFVDEDSRPPPGKYADCEETSVAHRGSAEVSQAARPLSVCVALRPSVSTVAGGGLESRQTMGKRKCWCVHGSMSLLLPRDVS